MYVIILNDSKTVAVVDSVDHFPLDTYEVVDSDDKAKVVSNNKVLQKQLQNIFKDILSIHGINVKIPEANNDPSGNLNV